MSKIKAEIWGREFELPIIVKKFSGEDSTETQKEAVERFKNNLQLINAAKPEVEKYILENGLKDNGITEVDNIFKYVIPKTISVPQVKNRVVAVMCDFKFDMENGLAIVFENEKFKEVGYQDLVL